MDPQTIQQTRDLLEMFKRSQKIRAVAIEALEEVLQVMEEEKKELTETQGEDRTSYGEAERERQRYYPKPGYHT